MTSKAGRSASRFVGFGHDIRLCDLDHAHEDADPLVLNAAEVVIQRVIKTGIGIILPFRIRIILHFII